MDQQDLLSRVADVAADVLGIESAEITEETTFDDLDANSLDRIQLVTAIEDEFDIEFPDEALEDLVSVGDALAAIESALEA
ncbi:acyl carrier protein [Collinsella sp. zg1085]|uniref:acyl carrier protein n=1 Tax=Collinsella sp. zg1085 TaxID=2844380 RepID=UPI001C0C514F|nr:acyl carrier protein [Collinsella sp. zg1085]QWT17121.1 acyl carrier protein [Collinsella sp. zg1085]